MRTDMYKVIVERPRRGGSRRRPDKGRLVEKLDRDFDLCLRNESMKFRWRLNRKSLNENLSPLYRFIGKQVGRPWNDVYSEICQHICVDSTVQKHVRDHVYDFVAEHVVLVDGKPYSHRVYSNFGPIYEDYYVHPDTGILCRGPQHRRFRFDKPKHKFEQVSVDSFHKFVKIKDIWYYVSFAPLLSVLPERGMPPFDVVLGRWTTTANHGRDFKFEWGAPVYATAKRQANKREIRRHILPELAPAS